MAESKTGEYTRPFRGRGLCERCKSAHKKTPATRLVVAPNTTETVRVCRACANVWNESMEIAIRSLAEKIASGEVIIN